MKAWVSLAEMLAEEYPEDMIRLQNPRKHRKPTRKQPTKSSQKYSIEIVKERKKEPKERLTA